MGQQLLLLELNEINFDYVRYYADQGRLPNFARLIDIHGVSETTSEKKYEELEPWIQWVTAHTGLPFGDHNVFRLGDIVQHDLPQIWEELESKGLKVGAISPMNAKNRTKDAAFFVPDPWTPTEVTGSTLLRRMYGAIAQAVNDNAQGRLAPVSAAWLMAGAAGYARPVNYAEYMRMAATARQKTWNKAMFLDLLLADVFIRQTRRTRPDFASLFVNAGAHIQHHYMFNSSAYGGPLNNPVWYVSPDQDPVFEVYALYDRIVGQISDAFPSARLMIATGLHQDPHDAVTYYWRLRNHADYLRSIDVPFERVEPRMSRDFFIFCRSDDEAIAAERILASAKADDGTPLFDVDNRGGDLFVMLTWPRDIPDGFTYSVGNATVGDLRDQVAFVAIKNGQHNGIGYFLDTGADASAAGKIFPLAELPRKIAASIK